MQSDIALLDRVTRYIVKHKGKGLRPVLVLLSARLAGTPNDSTYIVASVVELLHTATLVHDDVVDDADVRRSFPSINAIWKNKISVLLGDYLLSKSLIGATQTGKLEIMQMLAEAAKRLSKGELLQIEKSRKLDITEGEYYRMISDKTAALISASCVLGGLTVTDDKQKLDALYNYGENLGIAFQIKDDLLDYTGTTSIVGKPVGNDIRGKKITLPLILAMRNAPQKEARFIIKLLKKGVSDKEVQYIIDFTKQNNGVSGAEETAREYGNKASDNLKVFSDETTILHAKSFIDYVLTRKK